MLSSAFFSTGLAGDAGFATVDGFEAVAGVAGFLAGCCAKTAMVKELKKAIRKSLGIRRI
jgi:hypothetical protein